MSNITKLPGSKEFHFGGLTLQLRLEGKSILQAEKQLGKSMFGLFYGQDGIKFPPTHELLIILQAANKTSGITNGAMVEAFEKYVTDGNSPVELQEVIQELLDEAGFFGKEKNGASTKNKKKQQEENEADELLSNHAEIIQE